MQLSEHFTLEEMIHSDYAIRKGLPNNPSPEFIKRMIVLCKLTLEPVRSLVGNPITITSGYRSPVVNHGIGGSSTSQHMKGEAADFRVVGMSNFHVVSMIARSTILFDQLIYEFGERGWVHISRSYTSLTQRMEIWNATSGTAGTAYDRLDSSQLEEL